LNPDSPRAQANAAQAEMAIGRADLAAARLAPALAKRPEEVQLALNLLAAQCQKGKIDEATMEVSIATLKRTRDTGTLLTSWFECAINESTQPPCPQLTLRNIRRLLDATMSNPRLTTEPGRLQDIYSLYGNIALKQHDPDTALTIFNKALDQQIRATTAFQQAAALGSAGYPAQGLSHLAHYESVRANEQKAEKGMPTLHHWVLARQHYWDNELIQLQATLREDAENQAHANP